MEQNNSFSQAAEKEDIKIYWDEPMSRHTTMQVGGPAAMLAQPRDIRELRRTLRLSQKTLGNFAGVTRFSVSYWEHDRTHPSATSRRVIFHVLETGCSSLRHLVEQLDAETAAPGDFAVDE